MLSKSSLKAGRLGRVGGATQASVSSPAFSFLVRPRVLAQRDVLARISDTSSQQQQQQLPSEAAQGCAVSAEVKKRIEEFVVSTDSKALEATLEELELPTFKVRGRLKGAPPLAHATEVHLGVSPILQASTSLVSTLHVRG
jgi:hypothetical protein